ncbi:MAG: hypothetical protein IJW73_08180 [Candidatus Gastranaerophilales bacterium]|nr:hypothetical protein [Candidatus Gastranaerophilales bacterium]
MKKLILILALLTSISFAGVLEDSYKIYPLNAENLFLSTISAINSSSKLQIVEIQSANGYILFLYGAKYYLLTLTKRYQNQTEIKVLPQNSDFSQGSDVAKAVFALIDNQLKNQPMEQVQ